MHGINYIHNVTQPSPLSISKTSPSPQTEIVTIKELLQIPPPPVLSPSQPPIYFLLYEFWAHTFHASSFLFQSVLGKDREGR